MKTEFNTSDFDYELPPDLIAQAPLAVRSASRLLCLDIEQKMLHHTQFKRIVDLLDKKDLLVFNDTKVMPARLLGRKESGGAVECMIERILSSQRALAQVKANKALKVGTTLCLCNAFNVTVLGRDGEFYLLHFNADRPIIELLNKYGTVPLPPYIQRQPDVADHQRYQTVYAKKIGAVAAPTAGLHFDEALLAAIARKGVERAMVTLHVGAGTFQPVRVESLQAHKMHREHIEVSLSTCQAIQRCRSRGGRVVAVGTTVVRCLETAAMAGTIKPYCGDTELFIRSGYRFRCVDALITNFHLPRSSLLMLVCAFGGYEFVLQAYREAVKRRYRFFS